MPRYLLALLFLSGSVFAQNATFVNYLKNNRAVIDPHSADQWTMIRPDAAENQFIILGEPHGAQASQTIDFSLLKYLNRAVGTRQYVAELDFAQAANINEYLKTGDERLLKTVFRTWVKEHAQWGNSDFYKKIVKIRGFNQTLPKDRRIIFTGIDQVQDYHLYFDYLNKMIGHKQSPLLDSIRLILTTHPDDSSIEEKCLFAKRFADRIAQDTAGFTALFGQQLPIFEFLILNLSHSDNASARKRPEYLFENFKQLYSTLHWENEKLYGMWGAFHSHQVPVYFVGEDFASKLVSSDHAVSKKVMTILCLPIDSKYNAWDPNSQTWVERPFSYDDKSILLVDGIDDIKDLSAGNPVTLFKISGPQSPYAKTGRLFNGASPQGRLIGDFRKRDFAYQYLVVFRNSAWLHPLPATF